MVVRLGIDLGTTYSTAAASRDGRVELLSLGTRGAAVPSVVYLREDGEPLVGDAAAARGVGDPARFAREFKRRFGDPTPLILGGVPVGVDRLSAYVLAYMVSRATERLGAAPDDVVITHPATYTQYRLDLLREAARLAGLEGATFLAEPQAAALHYAADNRVADGETVAVYDLGGGTFDAAVLRRRGETFELLGDPQGLDRFGGIDIDLAVFEFVTDQAARLLDGIDPDDAATRVTMTRLRNDCRDAKERLSADTETVVPVATPRGAQDVVVTRRQLEAMIRPRLADTAHALRRAIESAGVTPADITRVLLVGGSSRIPLVRTTIAEALGRPVSVDADPESSIALGAALAAPTAAPALAAAIPAAAVPPPQMPAPSQPVPPAPVPSAPVPSAPVRSAPVPPAPMPTPSAPASAPAAPAGAAFESPTPTPPSALGRSPSSGADVSRSRNRLLAAVGAVAVVIAAVVVFVVTRPDASGKGGTSNTAAPTAPATTPTTEPVATVSVATVRTSDVGNLAAPAGFHFESLASDQLQAIASGFKGVEPASAQIDQVQGSKIVSDATSTSDGSLVIVVNESGGLGTAATDALIASVLEADGVANTDPLAVAGLTGTRFVGSDASKGWVGAVGGQVVVLRASGAGNLEQLLAGLGAANPQGGGTDPGASTLPADTASVTTPATNGIDVVRTLQVEDFTAYNPPAGFHFEVPLSDADVAILQSALGRYPAHTPQIDRVAGTPLLPDGGGDDVGGFQAYFSSTGSLTAEQQATVVADTLAAEADHGIQALVVGPLSGQQFVRSDGSLGWVGPLADGVLVLGLRPGNDIATMLTALVAANPGI